MSGVAVVLLCEVLDCSLVILTILKNAVKRQLWKRVRVEIEGTINPL